MSESQTVEDLAKIHRFDRNLKSLAHRGHNHLARIGTSAKLFRREKSFFGVLTTLVNRDGGRRRHHQLPRPRNGGEGGAAKGDELRRRQKIFGLPDVAARGRALCRRDRSGHGDAQYEGHDEPQRKGGPNPKELDQPLTTPRGSWTENGKFFRAAKDFESGLREKPELIKVYEKISRGIWSYKGFFELIDANIVSDGKRKVFKFSLKPVEKKSFGRVVELPHNRLIPTAVKVEVWRRDGGQCVQCGSTKNLHFDHDIPFSKGGSSLTAANVRLLCAKHNLEKSDKILAITPWIFTGAASVSQIQKLSG